jgi:ubiquinone/menaquinone biosynthesis C-methylase UbiE
MAQKYKNRRFFAKAYETGYTPWSTSREVDEDAQDIIVSLGSPMPDERMLDLGCGEGRITVLFAKNGFVSYGIDYIPGAISKAKKLAAETGVLEKTHFLLGNALSLPFEPDCFKVVIDSGCFHHIPKRDWPLYFNNLLRVLKIGGCYLLVVFSLKDKHSHHSGRNWIYHKQHYDHFFSQEELEKLFRPWFRILKIREIEKGVHVFFHLQMQRIN